MPIRDLTFRAAVVAFPLLLTAAAAGQTARVAIVSGASNTSAAQVATYNGDVRSKLLGTGLFAAVDIIDVSPFAAMTPTLAELQQYDAVLTYSNGNYHDAAALGDVLADFVDSGGGVVVTMQALASPTAGRYLAGRWLEPSSYEIVQTRQGSTFSAQMPMGTILVPDHPILEGVGSFNGGGTSLRPTTTNMAPHGQQIALWQDGKILVATSTQFPGRVDLGMLPLSTDVASGGWLASTDGARLMANALLYTIHGEPDCFANCDASTAAPVLNVADFTCFLQKFAAGDSYANCDESTAEPVLNVADFTCFLQRFAAGCP